MTTLIFVLVSISILILIHEWGHFYSARKLGVRVEEFGFGFPPKLFSRVKNGVRYSINILPFGGFVKIFGEHGEGEGEKESFISRSIFHRFIILSAGVGMNLALAWALFSAGSAIGVPKLAEEGDGAPVSIIGVIPGSPADEAGLAIGDVIRELRSGGVSSTITSEDGVSAFVDTYRGKEMAVIVERKGEIREIRAYPRKEPPEGEGPLGIALARLAVKRTPLFLAPFEGLKFLVRSIGMILYGLWSLIAEVVTEGRIASEVAGPVGIFFLVDDSRSLGLAYFLQFIGILSVNLAILNFLPIPALDGGRVLFLAIEKIKGTRVNPKTENIVHTIGFLFLIFLMAVITYKDIVRIF